MVVVIGGFWLKLNIPKFTLYIENLATQYNICRKIRENVDNLSNFIRYLQWA